MVDGLYGNLRRIELPPGALGQEHFRIGCPKDIHGAGVRQQPGIGFVKSSSVRCIGPGADAALAQVIPGCPHEIAHQVWQFLHHLPVFPDILREGLTAHHDAVRMLFAFHLVTA